VDFLDTRISSPQLAETRENKKTSVRTAGKLAKDLLDISRLTACY
jgi:hypothetical protein